MRDIKTPWRVVVASALPTILDNTGLTVLVCERSESKEEFDKVYDHLEHIVACVNDKALGASG